MSAPILEIVSFILRWYPTLAPTSIEVCFLKNKFSQGQQTSLTRLSILWHDQCIFHIIFTEFDFIDEL